MLELATASFGVRAYSPRSVQDTEYPLRLFIDWSAAQGLGRTADTTRPILEGYQRHLYLLRKPDGKPLTFRSPHVRLSCEYLLYPVPCSVSL